MNRIVVVFYYWRALVRGWSRIAILLIFCLFGMEITMNRGQALAADVELLIPRPGATVVARKLETHLVLRQSGPGNLSTVKVESSGAILEPVVAMEGEEHIYLHFRLPLEPGKNSFVIVPGGQRVELNFQQIQAGMSLESLGKNVSFFHEDDKLPKSCRDCHDLKEGETTVPSSGLPKQTSCVACHQNLVDKGTWKHSTTVNQQCLSCHRQSAWPLKIGFPVGEIQDICFTCHTSKRKWLLSKFVHGPMSYGGCTLCHNPHSDNFRYQLWADGPTLCITCHEGKRNLMSNEVDERTPYVHSIVFAKGCVVCHDPHATDEEFMLYKPINTLCLSCHRRPSSFLHNHPVTGHPVASRKRDRRSDRRLTCTSCHDPHGSSHPLMLIETSRGGRLCRVCHH